MAVDRLKGVKDSYDVIVIGSGLAGLSGANYLAKQGHSVLLLEHHYKFGGLATWFTRKGGHIFDISLHGFPHGMIKSARKYWTKEIADSIIQLQHIRLVNPDFDIDTSFNREDFTRILNEKFKVDNQKIEDFFVHLRNMNFYDNDKRTTGELFEEFFPGRPDIHRLLIEPIAYANGSNLDDPAITFGIVFSNFMNKGVFLFQGGTDTLITKMVAEMERNGVEMRKFCTVEKILTEQVGAEERETVRGVVVNGREIACKAVLSNSNIKTTLFNLLGKEHLPADFAKEAEAVRVNSSSCQVYMGLKPGEKLPQIGDLIFTSDASPFSSGELTDFNTKSRTFSVYYPDTRPHLTEERYAVVASLNAKWDDWAHLPEDVYKREKDRVAQESINCLERFVPGIREKLDWVETATPRTVHKYTKHAMGTSFGTKFEGLKISMGLSDQVKGLYHAGSVGIIMSGWLGAINYGIITANKMDKFLYDPNAAVNSQELTAAL